MNPHLLVAYPELPPFEQRRDSLAYETWSLDSGAFTALTQGHEIDVDEYTDDCRRLLDEDETLAEVFALDVIGDWRATAKNVDTMWARGVEAIPTFHYGSPWSELERLARTFPKIALGGVARLLRHERTPWLEQCFARVWPKAIHGFGIADEQLLMRLPFHSSDASSWDYRPAQYGQWKSLGVSGFPLPTAKQNLRGEIAWYMRLEERLRGRWAAERARYREELPGEWPCVRLAVIGSKRALDALEAA